MGCPIIYAKVINGPYLGFTLAQMEVELARYQAEMQKSGSRLIGAQITGESFQFGPRSDWSLPEWAKQIQFALAQVSPEYIAPSSRIVFQF